MVLDIATLIELTPPDVMLLPNLAMNFSNVRTRMLEHEARERVKVLSLITSS